MNDDPHASDELPMALSLEQVQQRFESWRQRRKKRTHIPKSLWKAAVALNRAVFYRAQPCRRKPG
jgi:hypothetical protein